ncbi:MAG: VCBS repeat-containing protein [Planctomycetes bacterium]|nr:VCBS repeat-containing protein [Planctomycetota bacterium]
MKTTRRCAVLALASLLAPAARADFGAPLTIDSQAQMFGAVQHADLDGDGRADLIAGLQVASGGVRWYRNLGGGAFAAPVALPVPFDYDRCTSIVAGDVDLDGDVDLILNLEEYEPSLGNWDDAILLRNQGGGTFTQLYLGSRHSNDMELVDVDGDGRLDWLYLQWAPGAVYLRKGDGVSFGPEQLVTTQALGTYSITTGDLDGDGSPDLVVAEAYTGDVHGFLNDGSGSFGAHQLIASGAPNARSVRCADLDEDGDDDVLVGALHNTTGTGSTPGFVAWYANLGGGVYGAGNVLHTNFPGGSFDAHALDVDGDGRLDVVHTEFDHARLYRGLGAGVFAPAQVIASNATSVFRLLAADFDGDASGLVDLVLATSFNGTLELHPQLLSTAATSYCAGPTGTTTCPCGNAGGELEGCANSTGAGVRLFWAGSASVAAHDLFVSAHGGPPNQPALFFQGLNAISAPFVDGLRCAGGAVQRLGIAPFDAAGATTLTGDLAGLVGGLAPGDVRHYQLWYRDPAGACSQGSNLSAAISVAWQ